jgi:hypothetical protein
MFAPQCYLDPSIDVCVPSPPLFGGGSLFKFCNVRAKYKLVALHKGWMVDTGGLKYVERRSVIVVMKLTPNKPDELI